MSVNIYSYTAYNSITFRVSNSYIHSRYSGVIIKLCSHGVCILCDEACLIL